MTRSRFCLPILCVLGTACFPPALEPGRCVFGDPLRGCRPTLTCRYDGLCVEPCTEPVGATDCPVDGGVGFATCAPATGWTACVAYPCEANERRACDPGLGAIGEQVCVGDAGFGPCVCTGADTQCGVERGGNTYFGRSVCRPDGGVECLEQSACSLQLGVCRDAGRLLSDGDPSCSATSYGATFRAVETCGDSAGADGLDNDCDGFIDELPAGDGGVTACREGAICQAVDASGRLRAYQRCATADDQCTEQRLTSLLADAGFAPLDLCDGVDRDCSGFADIGPARVVETDVRELALRNEPNLALTDGGANPARYMLAVLRGDGRVSVLSLDSNFNRTDAVGLGGRPGGDLLSMSQGFSGVNVVSWRADGGVALALVNPTFKVAAAAHLSIDAGFVSYSVAETSGGFLVALNLQPSGSSTVFRPTAELLSGFTPATQLPPTGFERLEIAGNGRSIVAAIGKSGLTSAFGFLGMRLSDGGYELDAGVIDALPVLPPGTKVAASPYVGAEEQPRITMALDGTFACVSRRTGVMGDRSCRMTAPADVSFGAIERPRGSRLGADLVSVIKADGGPGVLAGDVSLPASGDPPYAVRLNASASAIAPAVAAPGLAWNPLRPDYAALAVVETIPDGGTAVTLRAVCTTLADDL